MPNIAIVWDFDGTLTPIDSTTKVVEIIQAGSASSGDDFWKYVKSLRGDQRQPKWEHGDTDVPALSLVRSQGGIGVAVYNSTKPKAEIEKRLKHLRLDKRTDLITPADFSERGELFRYLSNRCEQVALRYRAEWG